MVARRTSLTEHALQKQIVQLFRQLGFKVFVLDAMSGAGYFRKDDPRRFAFIADLKARGYTVGQPDLCVVRNKVIFLELKKSTRSRVRPEQHDMYDWLIGHGHNAFIISSVDEALRIANNELN